jgi:hypothetical protein
VKYFIALIIFIVLLGTVVKTAMFVRAFSPQRLVALVQGIEEDFPDDLVIDINSMGRLSTNYDKPIILFSPMQRNPQPLVVIDPKAQKDKIYEYNAHALLAERYMVIRVDSHVYTLHYQLNEPMEIDKSDILTISHNAQIILESYWVWITTMVIGFLLIAPPLIFVTNAITLMIISAVVYICTRLLVKRARCTYVKVFQISLHTVTAPLLIQTFLFISGHTVAIPYWFIILNYVFLAGGLYEAYFDKD